MAYKKQKNNPINFGEGTGSALKKIDTSAGSFGNVDFNKTGKSSGPYSTASGDLMSGTGAGLGEFGKTDTKIGGRNREGKQEVYEGFKGGGVGRDIDRSNKGMKSYPERKEGQGLAEHERNVRKANYTGEKPKRQKNENIEASMKSVQAMSRSTGSGGSSGSGSGGTSGWDAFHGAQSKRMDARQARRKERRAARQERRSARKDARRAQRAENRKTRGFGGFGWNRPRQ